MPPAPFLLLSFVDPTTTEAAHLPLALLLIFGTAKILANLFERFGQPGLIGEILAGVLIGPGVLNWARPDLTTNALAEMGVMFLLFRVGLEVKASELTRVGVTALGVAVLGVCLPFAGGVALMSMAGMTRMEAIFVGAALVATSVGITAQVLAARGLLKERASLVILGAAIIDDILGLLVLAVVSGMAKGGVHPWALATTAGIAVGFTLLLVRYGTPTFQHVVPRVERSLRVAEGEFHLAMVLLFALAVAAVYIGVAAIVGAFLAGLALSESVTTRVRDLAHGVTELLVPFFLAGIGMHLDLSLFADRRLLLLTLALIAVAVITKCIGCGLGAWPFGRADMLRVGVGMIPRGEVGMVVAQIGLGLGVIERPVYGMVVVMAIATTLIAPPLLKVVYRGCQPGVPQEEFNLG